MDISLLSSVITGGNSSSADAAAAASSASAPASIGLFGSISSIVIYILFFGVLFYFLAIRPQKKREKQLVELQDAIKVGDSVLLESGIYGKITDITDQCFIIELGMNKGVLIPVLKQRIISIAEPNLTTSGKDSIEKTK